MAQIVSRGGPRNVPSGVVTVAELLSRNQSAEPAESSPISVGSLLRREGRGPHSLDRPLQPRGTQQPRDSAASGSKRIRRTVVAAGTFLAAGSVFGAAMVSDPSGYVGDLPGGIFPGQPDGPAGAGPGSGTTAIVDAAQSGPGGLDPGTAWSNVAFPRPTSSAPVPGNATARTGGATGQRTSNPAAGGGQTSGGTQGSTDPGGTQTTGGTGSTGGTSSSGGSGTGSSGGGTGTSGGGSGSGSSAATGPVGEVLDGTGKVLDKTTDDVAKVVDKTTDGVGDVLGKTTDTVGGLLGRTTGKGLGFGGSSSDDPSPSKAPDAGKVVKDQVDAVVDPVGKIATGSLGAVDSITDDSLGAVDDAGEVVEGTVGEVDEVLGTLLTGDSSSIRGTDDDSDADTSDERQQRSEGSTGTVPALSMLDDPGFETVEKSDEPESSSAKKHKSDDESAGDNPALSTLDDPVLQTLEKTGRHAAELVGS